MKLNFKFEFIIAILFLLNSCQLEKEKQDVSKTNSEKHIRTLGEFKKLNSLNTELLDPVPGEWLYSQNESGQSFTDYINSNPICPNSDQNVIYLNLIGNFDTVDLYVLKKLKKYTEIFFGLKVIMNGSISDSIIPKKARRIHLENEQLHTKYILHQILKEDFPKDAIVNMAITSLDLYPKESWNFVFGQASLKDRVGVSSIYRYKYENLDTTNYKDYMIRILKTTTHEITHMFSIKHCKDFKCLMNGSISLTEADKKPSWLCGECSAKLIWCTRNDVIKRYDELMQFYQENDFPEKVEYYKSSKEIMLQ